MPNPNAPHKAVILIRVEILEQNPDGLLDNCKDSTSTIISIYGKTEAECTTKTKNLIEEAKKLAQT